MKLHILYSGSSIGGAQNFVFRLAKNGFSTSTILHGTMQATLESKGRVFLNINTIKDLKWEVIVLSDLRALLFFVQRHRYLKYKEVYFIPHSDKLLKYAFIINNICSFFKITILPTTRSQMLYFNSSSWYLVGDIPDKPRQCLSDRGLIYFGRFEKVKRLSQLVDDFVSADDKMLGTLTLLGEGQTPLLFKKNLPRVNIMNSWLKTEELNQVIDKNLFNIVYSRYEGLSLSSLEALGRGLTPLFFSRNSLFNYGLNENHLVRGPKEFSNLRDRVFLSPIEILDNIRESSKGFEFLYD